jgi:LacI family transcriptional regulator
MVEDPSSLPARPVTRADVARYAGVSSAVVSYVINNGPKPVAESTAARVRAAIDLLGYRPNVIARALRGGSTRVLGLVVSDISNPFFTEFALQIEAEAGARGYALMMANSHADAENELRVVADLFSRQVDGLILASVDALSPRLRRLKGAGPRVVIIDCPIPVPGHLSIGSDAASGSRALVSHLIEVHQQPSIALVIGEGVAGADQREFGWQQATRAAGLPDGPLARAAFSREGGYVAAKRLLDTRNPPSAIFASSDLQAVGAIRAIREQRLRIPQDVAVVSFDATKESEFTWPPLTAARQPVGEMAVAAVTSLLSASPSAAGHQMFEMDLVIRQSCGCPAPASLESGTWRSASRHEGAKA